MSLNRYLSQKCFIVHSHSIGFCNSLTNSSLFICSSLLPNWHNFISDAPKIPHYSQREISPHSFASMLNKPTRAAILWRQQATFKVIAHQTHIKCLMMITMLHSFPGGYYTTLKNNWIEKIGKSKQLSTRKSYVKRKLESSIIKLVIEPSSQQSVLGF